MRAIHIKSRGILVRWFRRWVYRLVREQAEIVGQAELWTLTKDCINCRQSIGKTSLYCPICGSMQHAQTEQLSLTDIISAYKLPQERPWAAYRRISRKA